MSRGPGRVMRAVGELLSEQLPGPDGYPVPVPVHELAARISVETRAEGTSPSTVTRSRVESVRRAALALQRDGRAELWYVRRDVPCIKPGYWWRPLDPDKPTVWVGPSVSPAARRVLAARRPLTATELDAKREHDRKREAELLALLRVLRAAS